MIRALVLWKAFAKYHAIELRRYALDTAMGIVGLYVIFLVIFLGARGLLPNDSQSGRTLAGIVVAFMVWSFAVNIYSDPSVQLFEEATTGTLEQLAMAPLGLARILVLRFSARMLFHFATIGALLVLMMATTRQWLNVDLVSVLPLVLLTMLGVQGLGLALGGVSIVAKKAQSLVQLVQILFVGLLAAPLDEMPFLKYAPLAWGNHLVRKVMIEGSRLWDLDQASLAFLAAHSAAWLLGGYVLFQRFDRAARIRGVLGHY